MAMTDPIADMLTRIRNANSAGKPEVSMPSSKVLVEIARGATNSEIAANLFMAEGTVKTHVGRLLSKLNARDRVGLVLIAFETGLVD